MNVAISLNRPDTSPVSRWQTLAVKCRTAAERGERDSAAREFEELNREIAAYLSSGGEPTEGFQQLLDEVDTWHRGAGFPWHWTFHNSLLR
jgi:hypothetical protein